MFRRAFVVVVAFVTAHTLHAQFSIGGTIKDQQANTPLSGATVRLRSTTDSTFAQSKLTDSLGRFIFQSLPADSFLLSVSFVGYKTVSEGVRIDSTHVKLDSLGMGTLDVSMTLVPNSSQDMSTVIVRTHIPPAVQKGDTVEINASQFKVNPDATAEDLAKKVPGITIQNGQVTAHGETVQKVTIDGRELFGDDATAALRNLPAEIIDKIQIFDRLSDQAQFTGFDDGSSTKGINIVTKANMRNGQFGRVFAGYGTNDRYSAGGNTTLLKDNRKIAIAGNFNNINQQNFSSQDLLGITSNARGGGGGGRGGGGGGNFGGRGGGGQGGGGNFGGFGNNQNFLVGQQSGINKTNAIGINYSDVWSPKLTVTGSYFFNNQGNTTYQTSNKQYFTGDVINQTNNSSSNNNSHRVNMRIEWKLDSSNQILIMPNVSFQFNSSNSAVTTDNLTSLHKISTTTNNNSDRNGNNLNNTILYRHSFAKRGRTFSINVNTSSNEKTGNVYVNSLQSSRSSTATADSSADRYTDQNSSGYQLSANLAYTEPLGQKAQLLINYTPSYSNNKADQQAFRFNHAEGKYSIFDTTLSNRFNNVTKAQNAGISFRHGDRDNQISFGVNYQHNTLLSDQDFPLALNVNKSFDNVLPNAMMRLKLSTRSNIRIFYRANTNNPSVTQLSNVLDRTNEPFLNIGNPDLKQQYTHIFSGRYTYTNPGKGILFVGNIFYQAASDYISNSTFINSDTTNTTVTVYKTAVVVKPGQQLTYPINLDGYRSVRSFVTFAFPVRFIKSNFNMNGGVTFSRLPGSLKGQTNVSKNTTYTAGAVIASNVSQYVDFTVSYTGNFNTVENDLQSSLNDKYYQHVIGLQLNLLSKSGWFFQNDLNNQLYNGLTAGYNQKYTLWNLSAGKKFLKSQKGELKLTAFDVLRQNQSIARNVTETYIEDVQSQVLRQYFLLTFTYNLRTFGTAARNSNMNMNRGDRNFGRQPRF